MKTIILSYSGHYPDRMVVVSQEEEAEINRLTQRHYLFDTEEGRELLERLSDRSHPVDILKVIAYA